MSDENEARDTLGRVTLSDVDAKTRVSSADEQSSCDDDQNLRNEAISLVSGPLSVVRCEAETIDEPRAPGAGASERSDAAGRGELDREIASKWISDQAAKLALLRSQDLSKSNEESQKAAAVAESVRQPHRAGHRNGKPGVQSKKGKTRVEERGKSANAARDLESIVNAILDYDRPRQRNT